MVIVHPHHKGFQHPQSFLTEMPKDTEVLLLHLENWERSGAYLPPTELMSNFPFRETKRDFPTDMW